MNNLSSLRKEYLIGLTVMMIAIVTAVWASQLDWSSLMDVSEGDGSQTNSAHNHDMHSESSGLMNEAAPISVLPGGIAYHTCSMHPSVKSALPGTCPICSMDLVPVTHEELRSGSITVDEGRRQIIGVKTGSVVKERFHKLTRLQGEVTFDETRLADISLRFDGWIGELAADYEGKPVQKGKVLFTVYSPELLSLQEQYLETFKRSGGELSRLGSSRHALLEASRKRLKLWGLSSVQITWLEKQGMAQDYVPIFSPRDGIVIEKSIVNGSAFKKGQRLLRIADLSTVWIEAFAYEKDLALIETGMMANVRLPNLRSINSYDDEFSAQVVQVDPFLDANTRTARVRLSVDNQDGLLMPGTFASVTIRSDLGEQLLVPSDSVMISGEKRIVFLDLGEGRLKPKIIKTGYSDGLRIVVREGLSEGDVIVISGNFLIAAESKLKSGVDQW